MALTPPWPAGAQLERCRRRPYLLLAVDSHLQLRSVTVTYPTLTPTRAAQRYQAHRHRGFCCSEAPSAPLVALGIGYRPAVRGAAAAAAAPVGSAAGTGAAGRPPASAPAAAAGAAAAVPAAASGAAAAAEGAPGAAPPEVQGEPDPGEPKGQGEPPGVEFWTLQADLGASAPPAPAPALEVKEAALAGAAPAGTVLCVRVPVPFALPPALLGPNERPWFIGRHEGVDALGHAYE